MKIFRYCLIILPALFKSNVSMAVDMGTVYMYSFLYQNELYYVAGGSYAELGTDTFFYFGEKKLNHASEELMLILRNNNKWFRNYLTIYPSPYNLISEKKFVLIEPAPIEKDSIKFEEVRFVNVVNGGTPGLKIPTPLSVEDSTWINTAQFTILTELEISICHLTFLTSKPLDKVDQEEVMRLSEDSTNDEVKQLAERLKAKGLLIIGSCSC